MKPLPILAALLITVTTTAIAKEGELREFTSSEGKSLTAKLIKLEGDQVTIRRADGNEFILPLSKLSDEDQTYVTDWAITESASTDWLQWRGPTRDGKSTETGLNTDWEANKPELLWRTSGLGSGMASLSIHEGKLFTQGEKSGSNTLICKTLENGETLWETATSGKGAPNGTPTVDPESGLVFGVSKDGVLTAATIDTGEIAWSVDFQNDLGGEMMSGWGYSEGPLIDGPHLICTPGASDAMIAALDKTTGEVIWKTDVSEVDLGDAGKDGAGYASIVISNGGGVKQYVTLTGRGLIGVNAETGDFLWNYNRIANGTANIPTPIVKDDYIFGSTGYGDGGTALIKLSKSGSTGVNASEEYYLGAKEIQNHHGGMILVDDHVYLGDGHNNGFPQCIELKSGDIEWEKQRGPGAQSAAITYADGHLFFRYQDHTMAVIEAAPSGYKLKGSFKIDSSNKESWPHPVIVDGKLYLRDQDELLVYDVSAK